MKRKDLILKAKGDVIAEADSFGHGAGLLQSPILRNSSAQSR